MVFCVITVSFYSRHCTSATTSAIAVLPLADVTPSDLITDTTDATETLPTDLTKLPRDPLKTNLHPTC